ncbi:MAG: hypothetical protein ACOC3V_02975 [bacterium]
MSNRNLLKLIIKSLFENYGFKIITPELNSELMNIISKNLTDVEIEGFIETDQSEQILNFYYYIIDYTKSQEWHKEHVPYAIIELYLDDGEINVEIDYS